MNYLAHALVLPPGGPDLVLGAALPDLLRSLDRRLPRLVPSVADRLEAEGAIDLARGVRAHHAADVCFHGLEAFRAAYADLGGLVDDVTSASVDGPRVRGFFLGHVLVELLLDAELLIARPTLAATFYEALALADRGGATRALEAACGAERGERRDRVWSPDTSRDLGAQLERFLDVRFLLDYATDDGLAHRLGQLLGRARQPLGRAGQDRLRAGLPAARSRIRDAVEALTGPVRSAVLRAIEL